MIDFQKYKHQTPKNNQGWPISQRGSHCDSMQREVDLNSP